MQLFSALGDEDPGDESFEQLFQRMKVMKGKNGKSILQIIDFI